MKKRKRRQPRKQEQYEFPVPERQSILAYLEELGQPASFRRVVKYFHLKREEEEQGLDFRLRAMLRDGQLMQDRRGRFCLPDKLALIKATIVSHPDGFGFAQTDDGDDLFLAPRQMRRVFPGDEVLVQEIVSQRAGKREAQIVEVIERNTETLIGRLFIEKGCAFVEPLQPELIHDIYIPQDYLHETKSGVLVNVRILAQPDQHIQPIGEIIEVIDESVGEHHLLIDIACKVHDIPNDWSEAIEAELAEIPPVVTHAAHEGRTDLTELPFVTVDGEDSQDFDDAVYCKSQQKGGWILYVGIADVSAYVKPGSALDEEAQLRGNSVYFPNFVVPMLPEKLSNGLCSLNPNVDRLSLVCEMRIDAEGKLKRYRFFDAVIKSKARLNYTEVGKLYAGEASAVPNELQEDVLELYALYQVLLHERRKRGAFEIETIEAYFEFGDNGSIERISGKSRNDAHRMIEECMLMANVAAARLLRKQKLPCLYRNHDKPSEERIENLREYLKSLGLSIGGGKSPTAKDYDKLIKAVHGRDDAEEIQLVLLRSMMQAVYEPKNIGHFGLAYPAYTHYTSPIRRYPDLLVHRAIRSTFPKADPEAYPYTAKEMEGFGTHCSFTERRADLATREVTDAVKCQYMQDKIGEEFAGKIVSVTHFGIFVRLDDLFVEGLVHITQLPQDYYRHDPIKHRLVGDRTGEVFRLLQPVRVRLARASVEDRQIDFDLLA